MVKQTLTVSGEPDLAFFGEIIAQAERPKIEEMALYRTNGGKYVAHHIKHGSYSKWYYAKICCDIEQVKEFLGYGQAAKELYKKAGAPAITEID